MNKYILLAISIIIMITISQGPVLLRSDSDELVDITCVLNFGTSLRDGNAVTFFEHQKYIPIRLYMYPENLHDKIFLTDNYVKMIQFTNIDNAKSAKLVFKIDNISKYHGGKYDKSGIHTVMENGSSIAVEGKLFNYNNSLFEVGKYKVNINFPIDVIHNDSSLAVKWSGRINYNTKYILSYWLK